MMLSAQAFEVGTLKFKGSPEPLLAFNVPVTSGRDLGTS
jgi:hypothetical protein